MSTLTRFFDKAFRQIKAFKASKDGLAAVEFALVSPLLVTMFLGFSALAQGQQVSGRVAQISATVGDIIAQSPVIAAGQIDGAMLAGQVLLGKNDNSLRIEVLGIEVLANGRAYVRWARGLNTPSLPARNSRYNLPQDLTQQAGYFVMSRASLEHSPTVGGAIISPYTIVYTNYYAPRSSFDTQCSNCY